MEQIKGLRSKTGFRSVGAIGLASDERKAHFVVLAIAAATVLAACGSSSGLSSSGSTTTQASQATKAASGTPYVIPTILSETGTGTVNGSREAKALKGLEALVNKQGGIDGHPVQFDIQDNQSTPSTAVMYATSLISSHAPLILSGSNPPVEGAVSALATSNGPFIYQLGPAPPPSKQYVFAADTQTYTDAQAYLAFLKSRGITRIAAITSSDAGGVDGWNSLTKALAEPQFASIKVLTHQTFDPAAVSVTTQLSVIKATNPQALIIWTIGTPLGTVLQGMSSLGMENIPVVTSNGNAAYSALTHFASIMPKTYYVAEESLVLPPADIANAAVRAKVETFDRVIKAVGGHPEDAYGLAWDPAELMIGAIKKLGVTATAPQILNYMENLHNATGVFGVYNFSASDHSGLSLSDMFVTVWNGSSFAPVSGPGGTPLSAG